MALTRAMLKGMGLTDEQIGAIIEEHTNVTGGLKDQIKTLKESADKLPEVEKELNDLKAGNDDWKGKYEKEHKAFDDYRKDISNKETLAKVKAAYRKLLKDANVGESHHDSILKVTDFSNIKLNEDGTLADAGKLKDAIKKDWSGFIATSSTKGAGAATPPGGSDAKPSGRAAQLAAQYHDNLYGKVKEN